MSRRIELGISLEQAARDTNIRARMLEALESGDYSQYPPRGHAIGMLSSTWIPPPSSRSSIANTRRTARAGKSRRSRTTRVVASDASASA